MLSNGRIELWNRLIFNTVLRLQSAASYCPNAKRVPPMICGGGEIFGGGDEVEGGHVGKFGTQDRQLCVTGLRQRPRPPHGQLKYIREMVNGLNCLRQNRKVIGIMAAASFTRKVDCPGTLNTN